MPVTHAPSLLLDRMPATHRYCSIACLQPIAAAATIYASLLGYPKAGKEVRIRVRVMVKKGYG